MLFLVSGASGVGKSTVRPLVAQRLGDTVEAVELRDLGEVDDVTVEWRQDMAEVAAARASALRPSGRHLLLCGDPVAAGEVIAAPSAVTCGGVAVCLLDADDATRSARLTARGDDPQYLPAHLGFAGWMREHAADPLARLEVLAASGSSRMRWERLPAASGWHVETIDTSTLTPGRAADRVADWIDRALREDRLVMHPESWPT